MTHDVNVAFQHCYKCGILFAVPDDYDREREKDGRRFWCPNGHGQHYLVEKTSTEELQAVQRAEQLEAKVAELQSKLDAPATQQGDESAETSGQPSPGESDAAVRSLDGKTSLTFDGRRWQCGCGHSYKAMSTKALYNHLRRIHKIEHDDAHRLRQETWAAWNASQKEEKPA